MASVTKHPPLKDPGNNAVRVEIFDQAYNLRGSDADYIIKLAEYVDSKMRAVAEQTHTVDTARLAVLAALNIADEYHLLKRSGDTFCPVNRYPGGSDPENCTSTGTSFEASCASRIRN